MSQRFFVDNMITGSNAHLESAEAHHFLHVMRGKVGEKITLFDGTNQEFLAQVTKTSRSKIECEILDARVVDRESSREVTLGAALPKGDRARWLVEKLTELGVSRMVPLRTQRGVAQPNESVLDRLRRAVIEASKQCGRNRLMEIAPPRDFTSFIAVESDSKKVERVIAHPEQNGAGDADQRRCAPFDKANELVCAVGPEGGFTEEEVALARSAEWKAIDLGQRILRIETAAVTLAAWAALE